MRARHAPRASQMCTVSEPDLHRACTVCAPDGYCARTRLMWAMELVQMEVEAYFGIYSLRHLPIFLPSIIIKACIYMGLCINNFD